MKNEKDKLLKHVIEQKKLVIKFLKNEKRLNKNEVDLLDEAMNLLLFNQMVTLDGGDSFSEKFLLIIVDLESGKNIIDSNSISFHERFFELDEELENIDE